ncbi:MAG: GTP pyrophosphokinase family protein [Clostridia bacterium]|nr:GTP pyrophosphokinase family protein [Clostridia bacterium]
MKQKKKKGNNLIKVENFMDYNHTLKVEEKTFQKLMFIYSIAIRELETKIGILKDEFETFYNYNLIDHIDTRVKTTQSIIQKMKKRNIPLTYKNMIENINDIAGIRIICPLKKDIFSIKDIIKNIPNINILKEKDYVTNPKKSGYSSYHIIVEVPVTLSQQNIYVKVEVQVRTIAMDFWSTLEHKMKYKSEEELSKKESKEWINCAKIINKLDNKMMLLNG